MNKKQQINIDSATVPFNKKIKYNDICNIFNLDKKNGNGIKVQINKLRKDFNIIKEGRFYIITNRYTPQEKLALQYYDNLKKHMESLLCTVFTFPKLKTVRKFSMGELMKILSLVNEDFYKTRFKENMCIAMNILDIKDDGLEFFMNETEDMLRRLIKEVMYSLEDKKLIIVEEIPVLAKVTYDDKGNAIKTNLNEFSLDNKTIKSQEELDDLLECFETAQHETLRELGFLEESKLKSSGKFTILKYRSLTAKKLGHDYYYYNYRLILNTKYIKNYAIQDAEERNKIREICNGLVKSKILKSQQGKLKLINAEDKIKYIDAFIDINNDYEFRHIYEEEKKNKWMK